MNLTNAAFQNQPGAGCTMSAPSTNGTGAGSFTAPGSIALTWEWSVPRRCGGAKADVKTTAESFNNGGASSQISTRGPSEFGFNAGARPDVQAVVPVGAAGKATGTETYTFTPNRVHTRVRSCSSASEPPVPATSTSTPRPRPRHRRRRRHRRPSGAATGHAPAAATAAAAGQRRSTTTRRSLTTATSPSIRRSPCRRRRSA